MEARFGDVTVVIGNGRTMTAFGDGTYLVGMHQEQPGQAETAAECGLTVEELNLGHDLAHTMLAHLLGLPWSPTLHAVAKGARASEEVWRREEAAVMALQAYAKAVGVDLVELATRAGT